MGSNLPAQGPTGHRTEVPPPTPDHARAQRAQGDPAHPGYVTRRWDNDTREVGIADGRPVEAAIRELLEACRLPGWVTEDADAHLGVHLRRRCEESGSPWTWLAAAQGTEGLYEIELAHSATRPMDIWRDAVALLSTIAEDSIHIRRVDDQTFEAATGMLPGDGDFASHGHTLRLRIRGGDGRAGPDR